MMEHRNQSQPNPGPWQPISRYVISRIFSYSDILRYTFDIAMFFVTVLNCPPVSTEMSAELSPSTSTTTTPKVTSMRSPSPWWQRWAPRPRPSRTPGTSTRGGSTGKKTWAWWWRSPPSTSKFGRSDWRHYNASCIILVDYKLHFFRLSNLSNLILA